MTAELCAAGYSEATGHFTQVVWASTASIGCGISFCTDQVNDNHNARAQPPSTVSEPLVSSFWPWTASFRTFCEHVSAGRACIPQSPVLAAHSNALRRIP